MLPGSCLCQKRIPLKHVIAISISIDSHGRECSLGDFYSLTDHGNRKILLMFKLHTPSFCFDPLFHSSGQRADTSIIAKLSFLCRKRLLPITMFQDWGHIRDRYPLSDDVHWFETDRHHLMEMTDSHEVIDSIDLYSHTAKGKAALCHLNVDEAGDALFKSTSLIYFNWNVR